MKKIISMLLCLVLFVTCFASCNKEEEPIDTSATDTSDTPTDTTGEPTTDDDAGDSGYIDVGDGDTGDGDIGGGVGDGVGDGESTDEITWDMHGKDTDGYFIIKQDNFKAWVEELNANNPSTGTKTNRMASGYKYRLYEDIVLNKNWDASAGPIPTSNLENYLVIKHAIGGNRTKFEGTFDGNGKTISGMFIYGDASTDLKNHVDAGMFSWVSGTVKNLKVVNSRVINTKAGYGTASIAGRIYGGTIDNCYSEAIVITQDTYYDENCATGGIVGSSHDIDDGVISNCVFAGKVTGDQHVGGILGRINNVYTTIEKCVNKGTVTSAKRVGGILGTASDTVEISHCTNVGEVIGTGTEAHHRCGGIIGHNAKAGSLISNCLNAGSVAAATYASGIIGHATAEVTVEKSLNASAIFSVGNGNTASNIYAGGKNGNVKVTSFYRVEGIGVDGYASGCDYAKAISDSDGGKWNVSVITLDDFLSADIVAEGEALAGWTYTGGFLPEPSGHHTEITYESLFKIKRWEENDGAGKAGTYYLLDNENFQKFFTTNRDVIINGNYMLTEDITVNTGKSSDWATGRDGVTVFDLPIKILKGTFDGKGHTISGLCMYNDVNNGANRFMGLFAFVYGTVKNLRIENSYFCSNNSQGYNSVGAISGRIEQSGTIENCYVDFDVIVEQKGSAADYTSIGGIVGDVRNPVAGKNATISKCVFAGTVRAEGMYAGGIVGIVYQSPMNISNCINLGSVSSTAADRPVGGILGRAWFISDTIDLTITNCMNLSTQISGVSAVGEIIGTANPACVKMSNVVSVNGFRIASGVQVGNTNSAGTAITFEQLVDSATPVFTGWDYAEGMIPDPFVDNPFTKDANEDICDLIIEDIVNKLNGTIPPAQNS